MTNDDLINLKIDLNTTDSSLETIRKLFHDPSPDDLTGKRFAYVINTGSISDDGQYIPCLAFENVSGCFPMRGDPAKHQTPWKWGADYDKACEIADKYNERLGLTKVEAMEIVFSSMFPKK